MTGFLLSLIASGFSCQVTNQHDDGEKVEYSLQCEYNYGVNVAQSYASGYEVPTTGKYEEYRELMWKYGYSRDEQNIIFNKCDWMSDPHSCIKFATIIAWIEGHNGTNPNGVGYNRNNLFSIRGNGDYLYYDTRMDSIVDWLDRYKEKRQDIRTCYDFRVSYVADQNWINNCEAMFYIFPNT